MWHTCAGHSLGQPRAHSGRPTCSSRPLHLAPTQSSPHGLTELSGHDKVERSATRWRRRAKTQLDLKWPRVLNIQTINSFSGPADALCISLSRFAFQ